MAERYWGVYCPRHEVWLKRPDGTLMHYPAEMIARAHVDELRRDEHSHHTWEAFEFGTEVGADREAYPVCPVGEWAPVVRR